MRSIRSVLDRATNTQNVHEVIVIDDYSDLGESQVLRTAERGLATLSR